MVSEADAAFEARSWAAAAQRYAAADAQEPLDARALERWGLAALLVGRDDESDAARERSHHAHLAAGDVEAAVRVGHWLGVTLVIRGEPARAGGWFARLQSLLDDHRLHDSPAQLFLRVSAGMQLLFRGDAAAAVPVFEEILAASAPYDDRDLDVLVRNGLGQSLVATGRIDEGLRRLDEVMVSVTSDRDVSPQVVGLMYCAGIDTCRRCFDNARAREWTAALSRWCAGQPDLVPYRGQCVVHRAEVLQLHGLWRDAHAEVERLFGQLGENPRDVAAGMAHYQRGELQRLRGDVDAAEAAYRRAAHCGHDPQPGLALLRLAQGRPDAAWAAVQRALAEDRWTHDRLRLLPAYVDIALRVGAVDAAAAAVDELQGAARDRDVPLLAAAAAQAAGQVATARGEPLGALRLLREAVAGWQQLGAPYDAALAREHLADACHAVGDDETARLELEAALLTYEQLGAAPALARVSSALRDLSGSVRGGARPSLTQREAQVLRMVATGATNRSIAEQLFLSEKTVARHVANIFLKLGVGTRAAATAYAYEQRLV